MSSEVADVPKATRCAIQSPHPSMHRRQGVKEEARQQSHLDEVPHLCLVHGLEFTRKLKGSEWQLPSKQEEQPAHTRGLR